jgi:serine/threonine protein kinase/Tfp pilus assembly protein PilF
MTPERYQRLGNIYHAALEYEPEARAMFLDDVCGSDEELRREIETLLDAHNKVGNYFASPALEVAAGLIAEQETLSLAGQSLLHYRVLSLIGAGGMGEVYLAEDTRLGRKVALKILPKESTQNEERVRRFEQEARAASALNHPNIVTIYEVGQVDGRHFIATEYIEGQTLRGRVSGGQMELREAVDIGTQMASALEAAHEAGIVHRDIKPENVMVRRDGLVKVLDFGLAKLAESQRDGKGSDLTSIADTDTSPGLVLGTLSYMSPEQARGESLDERTDIFSLGIVLYEMVAGQSPFAAPSGAETLAAILGREPKSLTQYAQNLPGGIEATVLETEPAPLSPPEPGVPAELERIVKKALGKNREERYQLAKDLMLDLRNLKQELELQAKLEAVRSVNSNGATATGLQAVVDTDERRAAPTTDTEVVRTVSSVEYLVSKIQPHRRSAARGLAVLLIAAAAIFYFTYFTRGGEAIDSIAVLPFVNVNGDPKAEYLSDGISDSIINSLSQLPGLTVISHTSALRYKGQQLDPQTVGRELNVRAVLMGKLTLRGIDLLISTELVDVRDNKRLWGDRYNRTLADLVRLQGEIAREIAAGLRLTLTGEQKERLAKIYTDNPEALRLYQFGRRNRSDRLDYNKARDYLEQAIQIDPNFAPAYAQLAGVYHAIAAGGRADTEAARQKSEGAARRALELDDTLGDAHVVLASHRWYVGDRTGALSEFERALELDPNSAGVHSAYAKFLWRGGRHDEALAHFRRAQELDPLSPAKYVDLGIMLYTARQYDQALKEYRKALDLNQNYGPAHFNILCCYLAQGKYEEADAQTERAKAAKDQFADARLAALGYAYAVLGKRAEAQKMLDEVNEMSNRSNVRPQHLALIYTGLGDKDKAFELLRKEDYGPIMHSLESDPVWDSLRLDPRFADLRRQRGERP